MLHRLAVARATTRDFPRAALLSAKGESGADTLLGEKDAEEAIVSKRARERERDGEMRKKQACFFRDEREKNEGDVERRRRRRLATHISQFFF